MTDRVHDTVVHELSRIAYALEVSVRDSEFRFRVLESLNDLREQGRKIMAMLDSLRAEVTAMKGTVASVLALIDGIVAKLKDAPTLEEVAAITDELETQRTALAAAAAANPLPTPAA